MRRSIRRVTAPQVYALVIVAARELLWGLRAVGEEVGQWRARAGSIPDAPLRADALGALTLKRDNVDGGALFWTLPRRRDQRLLKLLVRYEALAEFLDLSDERAACTGAESGLLLQRALSDALEPGAPTTDYFGRHPWSDDGGHLLALVEACRADCAALPGYWQVRPHAVRAATLAQVQALNHQSDPVVRTALLQAWAAREPREDNDLSWFERTATASAWLTVLAMLALAAEPAPTRRDCERIFEAYSWVAIAAAMLDSYADVDEDGGNGGHSYVAYYADEDTAARRICEFVRRASVAASTLPDGPRHAVIVAGMVAQYLSKDGARSPRLRAQTRKILHAGGPLPALLLPVLRIWQTIYKAQKVAPQSVCLGTHLSVPATRALATAPVPPPLPPPC
ncbi:MAG TPA: DUF2600 family protein [Solirubrobacteraceae bacterium]|jgi:tetraprenyl-beta-curcumene synthase